VIRAVRGLFRSRAAPGDQAPPGADPSRSSPDGPLTALARLEGGWLGRTELVGAIANESRTPAGRDHLLAQIKALSGREWVRLDGSLRAQQWIRPAQPFDDGGHPASVALASMAADGRVRERAIRRLATGGPVAGAALALRTADWVPVVAEVARDAIPRLAAADPATAAEAVPVLLALEGRRRASRLAADILALARTSPGHRAALLASPDRTVRRRLAADAQVIAACEDAELDRLTRDPDAQVAGQAAVAAAVRAAGAGDEARLLALLHGPFRARVAALDALGSGPRAVELASPLLFVSSPRVRGAAQGVLRRSGLDPAGPYRERALQGRWAVVAVEELGVLLGVAAVPALAEAASSDSPAMRLGAIRGARFLPDADRVELLSSLLRDPTPEVARAAGRQLRRVARMLDGAELRNMLRGQPHERRVAATLLRRRTTPERVWADIASVELGDDRERSTAVGDLASWLRRGAASARWDDLESRAAMAAALARVEPQLPHGLATAMRFNLGLRSVDLGA
jgi:hypothetical protein